MVEPLSWMLGTWLSEPPGAGTFPTLQPFRYLEEAQDLARGPAHAQLLASARSRPPRPTGCGSAPAQRMRPPPGTGWKH